MAFAKIIRLRRATLAAERFPSSRVVAASYTFRAVSGSARADRRTVLAAIHVSACAMSSGAVSRCLALNPQRNRALRMRASFGFPRFVTRSAGVALVSAYAMSCRYFADAVVLFKSTKAHAKSYQVIS